MQKAASPSSRVVRLQRILHPDKRQGEVQMARDTMNLELGQA